ncbi:MAG: branched-chain amino acid transport system permease protein, partial [Actinomycetota bacterium]|nr:branched-chain amino acid transport system permease protein [Actinomycetota bacterium]
MTLTTPEGAVLPVDETPDEAFRPGTVGLVGRGLVWVALGVALLLPMLTVDFAQACSLAAIYAIVGLSLNIVVGYTGQLSLGHQGFLGLGALVAANIVFKQNVPFFVGLIGGVVAATVAAV